MRLVIDLIRGRAVPEAYGLLKFSKKLAAKQIHKVLKSAVANAEQRAQRQNEPLDVDRLRVKYAVVNEGTTLNRFTPAAMGRSTPIHKRTSHVEIHVASDPAPKPKAAPPAAKAEGKAKPRASKAAAGARTKATKERATAASKKKGSK
jgi:large subunit ribosomal protein L22